MVSLLMTREISRRNASACDKATLTDKKIEGVPLRCPDTVLLGLGFINGVLVDLLQVLNCF